MTAENLTELERSALSPGIINLSDGHARQSLGCESGSRVREVFGSFMLATSRSDYFGAEREFLDCLAQHTGQRYAAGQCVVTYSSSVAMGMIATNLKCERRSVGVVSPTFDSIPGILTTMEVPVIPVAEEWLIPVCDFERLESLDIGALLLVAPNNPTGACLDRAAACDLLDWAARRHLQVILDLAFRWFEPATRWDIISEANARGADVLTIDDTGKILSLADLKAGVLSASRGLSRRIREIHDQYVLNVSELTLRLLTIMMEPGRESNEVARAIRIVGSNRDYLDRGIDSYNMHENFPLPRPSSPAMSVQWLHLPGDQAYILDGCRARGLEILPGRNFYWSTGSEGSSHARLAMMRDPSYFASGVDILLSALSDHLSSASVLGRR
jgi:aspartate/methionine/tyrosine aminotransferase